MTTMRSKNGPYRKERASNPVCGLSCPCGQSANADGNDQMLAKVPDLEHVILLDQAARRRGLEVVVTGRARKTVLLRGPGAEIRLALEETRRLGLKVSAARLRSLAEVLREAALLVPAGLMSALERVEAELAVANAKDAGGVNGNGTSGAKGASRDSGN